MKMFLALLLLLLLNACSQQQTEELVFRKTLEHKLTKLCDEDKSCVVAVKNQIKPCMEKADWRKFMDKQEAEVVRFTTEFYGCIVDDDGYPLFYAEK